MSVTITDPETTAIFIADALLKKLKAHRSPRDSLRFACEGHSPMLNLQGEGLEGWEHMEDHADGEYEEIIRLFGEAPTWDQRQILDGWNPSLLRTTREELINYIATTAGWFPAVQVSSRDAPGWPHDKPPSVTTHLIDQDMPDRVQVLMTVGITKAEAMKQLERLVNEIDEHWDSIISHEEKETL